MTDAFDTIATQRAAFLASGGGRVCLGNAAGARVQELGLLVREVAEHGYSCRLSC